MWPHTNKSAYFAKEIFGVILQRRTC